MIIEQDFHLHTHCSCDSASAQLSDIVNGAQEAGLKHWGISDHLHTQFNLPDIEIAAREFREFGPVEGFHFGIEVTCATQWECEKIARRDYSSCFTTTLKGRPYQTMTPIDGVMFGGPANGPLQVDITQADIDRLGIEYVIAGVHKPNYNEMEPAIMIDDFFNQSCYLIKHELVDILAHPWDMLPFWSGEMIFTHDPKDLLFEVYEQIPQEYWDELAHLLLTHGKLAEMSSFILSIPGNIQKNFMKQMATWRNKGVKFTFSTDLHRPQYEVHKKNGMEILLAEYGFSAADFALPFVQN